ncbi:hypothetical protein [Bathymodiolus thermophilus thioautotrophic gill symbiont]|nr:hypothetical protein [Bathymodiolus thermophilus thioautotrophic gill symbiont]
MANKSGVVASGNVAELACLVEDELIARDKCLEFFLVCIKKFDA